MFETFLYILGWVASSIEVLGLILIGMKNKIGFLLNAIGCAAWTYIAINNPAIYGLIVIVGTAFFLNLYNFFHV